VRFLAVVALLLCVMIAARFALVWAFELSRPMPLRGPPTERKCSACVAAAGTVSGVSVDSGAGGGGSAGTNADAAAANIIVFLLLLEFALLSLFTFDLPLLLFLVSAAVVCAVTVAANEDGSADSVEVLLFAELPLLESKRAKIALLLLLLIVAER